MSPLKKLEFDVEIEAPAHLFHDVMTYRPHCLNSMDLENVQNSSLESRKQGTVLSFDYTHDGQKKSVKDLIEKIDEKNLSTTWKVIDGDLLREYKSFKLTMQATPRGSSGSLAHITFEYEINNEGSPDPHSLMEFCVNSCKAVDAYLTNAQLNNN